MSQKDYDMKPRWYVVHTYSGYENKVKADLEQKVKNQEMEEYFCCAYGRTNRNKRWKKKNQLKKSLPWICFD